MEPFSVDKSFYDIATTDLKELWDSDMESSVCDPMCDDDWGSGVLNVRSHVVLHDRLMTDAILSDTPIKTEHSYCSQRSPSSSPSILIKDELEDDCLLPAVAPKHASGRCMSPIPLVIIKSEPKSEPTSPSASCSPSPSPPPHSSSSVKNSMMLPLESKNLNKNVLKQPVVLLSSSLKRKQQFFPSSVFKIEPNKQGAFSLPPTPPSSTSSDSEGNVSPLHPSSPSRRLFLSVSNGPTRQPIQTPLISTQPKGSTGTLVLTDEEKRTLVAEGYPIPLRLPLSKAEEKSLKKIRRKIKNKISAQESRRKKKEYMDALERKVQILTTENVEYKKKISTLEDVNSSLTTQVATMQSVISRLHGNGVNVRNTK